MNNVIGELSLIKAERRACEEMLSILVLGVK